MCPLVDAAQIRTPVAIQNAISLRARNSPGTTNIGETMKRLFSICLGLAVFLFSHRAGATTLFSDFGPGDAYQSDFSWEVTGSGAPIGTSYSDGDAFTIAGSGAEEISQIDIAIGQLNSGSGFYVSIWTDNSGLLGTEVSGAYWGNLSPYGSLGTCCKVTSITGISGVTLTGGDTYFLLVGPMNPSGSANYGWNFSSVGLDTAQLYSTNGGVTWQRSFPGTAGAFDVIGSASAATPEPGTFLMLGSGLVGLAGMVRRRFARG
ncbi:MAG: choice-of-anchor R domain-containing protein [Terracidiphilus sp.]